MTRSYLHAVCVILCAAGAFPGHAQLNTWLVREVNGVHLMDLTTPVPTFGPLIPGLGTGGVEHVNLMTDGSNNLLFTVAVNGSNSTEVWNAAMAPMPNGTGLLDHSSTLQSAICPVPCHPERYYIVHEETLSNMLYYSIVDMTLDGGLGDVTQKNILIGASFSEALAISHRMVNGCRWLFCVIEDNGVYALSKCLISESGIGPPQTMATFNLPSFNSTYEVELSPDNSRLAVSIWSIDPVDPDIMLWDLDISNGTVSNPVPLSVSDDAVLGLQFSPAGGYLYFLCNSASSDMDLGRVRLSDLTVELIDANMGSYLTQVELAGNGRLYVSQNFSSQYMAEISLPDAPTVASIGYVHDALLLGTGSGCRPALPNTIEGELPGEQAPPGYIAFSAQAVGGCDTYQFQDSTCLSTWWEWDLGDGTITNTQVPIHQFAPGVYDITLRVVACGDTLSLTKPAYITSSTVAAAAVLDAQPDQVCVGGSVQFTNTSTNASDIAWDLGDGTTGTGDPPDHAYASAGTHMVTLVASNACGSDTAFVPITVLGTAAVPDVVSDPCQLTVQVSSGTVGAGSVLWLFGDGATASDSAAVHDYAQPGSFNIALIVDPGTACADTAVVSVVVGNGPSAAFAVTLLCDLVVEFADASTPGSTLLWDFDDGSGGSSSFESHTYADAGPFVVQLIATDGLGCTDTASIPVTPIAALNASFDVLTTPCTLQQAFTNTSVGGSVLAWDFGDGGTDDTLDPLHGFASPGTYLITLIVDPGTACADTTNILIPVSGAPLAAFTDSIGCEHTVQFSDASLGADLVHWVLGDGSFSDDPIVVHTYPAPGQYEVLLVALNTAGCADSVLVSIDVPPDVHAVFTAQNDICAARWNFTNASVNASGYIWSFGDGTGSIDPSPSHVYVAQGTFITQLIAFSANDCNDTTYMTIAAADGDVLPGLFVPNCFTPNGDGVNERFMIGGVPECFDLILLIFNRWGGLIHEDDRMEGWDGLVDGSLAPTGTYVYLIIGNGQRREGTITLLR
ncbi:MAG: PKD domain-containing protein [Flavobacteriales bacterium]|nr:PKD domain-containing protein [Flavobacteriales bacterium]